MNAFELNQVYRAAIEQLRAERSGQAKK